MATYNLATAPRTVIEPLRARSADQPCCLCDTFDEDATTHIIAAGRELFRQSEPSYKVFRVRAGAVATYRLFSDGRRQVMSFYLPGDFVGMEAGVEYGATAVALTQATVDVMRRSELSDLASSDPRLSRALWQVSLRAFHRSEEHALVLARHGAVERVVAFLVDFAARTRAGSAFELPMTRQDLADYLGLTIHTVSRTLSQLEASGLIEARSSRVVRLLQPESLEGMLQ
ncbi:helix-turn-helix domain-containing protein [Brevundimonas viscosa]|uniref:CRP/FNR family transcriptional regulator, anaerobic regulatory protein/CRP/FNR family transcriptional regulator, nitrogen fixation regulation protein n=1 Tax=Brevundimonas viscosa TaxID=871741 RepID=A0A1I6T3G0_9CAUL|nr:helix-turn-helix domain-containing protein [Brevundimonas viscosa]SFS83673.1 CRP/FNR family transcriptional regulator, anaerobic regulatory protein/CRP/FNR family transcriptional regulator, nitrogen fixation regulation protein [Brevundimonas viscosa]